MLSPPPSPLPHYSSQFPPSELSADTQFVKKATGRRYRLLIFLIPAILVLLTAPCHHSSVTNNWDHWDLWDLAFSPSSHAAMLEPKEVVMDMVHVNKRQSGPPPQVFSNPLVSPSVTPTPTTADLSDVPSATSARDTSIPPIPTDTPTAPGIVPTPFPQPFDVSLSSDFATVSCQNFFLNFTQDEGFRQCRPFSLLLASSEAFTSSQKNTSLLTDIMWGTCNTVKSASDCHDTMDQLVSDIQSQCKDDLQKGNVLAMQALTGFQIYAPMRQAGCLIDKSVNSYCFVEAVANSSPADLFFYQLPYGNTLPNGTVPSCSPCIKSVLNIYAQAVTNPSSTAALPSATSNGIVDESNSTTSGLGFTNTIPLDQTYGPAAQIAVQQCGSVYAQQVNVSAAPAALALPFHVLLLLFPVLIYISLP